MAIRRFVIACDGETIRIRPGRDEPEATLCICNLERFRFYRDNQHIQALLDEQYQESSVGKAYLGLLGFPHTTWTRRGLDPLYAVIVAQDGAVFGFREHALTPLEFMRQRIAAFLGQIEPIAPPLPAFNSDDTSCPVCLDELDREPRVLQCGHRFHADCIDTWRARRSTCPVCRAWASSWS